MTMYDLKLWKSSFSGNMKYARDTAMPQLPRKNAKIKAV